MQVQYHEFAASIEDEKTSARGRRQDRLRALPEGRGELDQEWRPGGQRLQLRHRRHRHQRQRLGRPEAGGLHLRDLVGLARATSATCSRASAARRPASRCWPMPDVQAARKRPTTMPNALTFDAVYDFGIKDPNFVLGPKIPKANEYHQIMATEAQKLRRRRADAGGSLRGDQAAARRPARSLSRTCGVPAVDAGTPTPPGNGMRSERDDGYRGRGRAAAVPRRSVAAAGSVAARRVIDYAPPALQRAAVAALLFLPDAAGDHRAGLHLASIRSSGSST